MQLVQNPIAARHYYLPMLAAVLYAVSDSTSCITAQLRYNKSKPEKGIVFYATSALRTHHSIHAKRILYSASC
jgi:hypothetical protein